MQKKWLSGDSGFTIIELLIVIAIIAILTMITAVGYNGLQMRSRLSKMETDITAVQKLIEAYKARNGTYPITATNLTPDWITSKALTDADCPVGVHRADWVPDLTASLPQSQPTSWGVEEQPGCYLYASDGRIYVISAWNMLRDPQTEKMYRRLGFREMHPAQSGAQTYLCNYPSSINGLVNGVYMLDRDYYKRSLTLSNITSADCDETPLPGA